MRKSRRSDIIFSVIVAISTLLLTLIPNKFIREENSYEERARVEIVATDNSLLHTTGIIQTGDQLLTLVVLEGTFKGDTTSGINQLTGRLEFDKVFNSEDIALAVITKTEDDSEIQFVNVIDHYRINIELWLIALFGMFLIAYAGWVGVKSILSFIFTGVIIWRVMLPGFLMGYSPILLSIVIVLILTFVIIFLVSGFNRRGSVAFMGAAAGIAITCILAIIFGDLFKIHGAIKSFSESLLYTGFAHINLTDIFLAGIFLSSSGAVMDIAMDISASQNELIGQNSSISKKELIKSGFSVGRAVVGTMTTTLLLAYSGGFTALLMVFIARGTPATNIMNLNYVAGEVLHTMVGSFGLVLVAPLTAIIGGYIYKKHRD